MNIRNAVHGNFNSCIKKLARNLTVGYVVWGIMQIKTYIRLHANLSFVFSVFFFPCLKILKWTFASINWSRGVVRANWKYLQLCRNSKPLHFHVPGTEGDSKHPVIPWISIYKSSCYHLQNIIILEKSAEYHNLRKTLFS